MKRFLEKSLALLIAGGAGLGMFAVSGGSAYAALSNSDGSLIPVFVQGGPVSLPGQTNSIKITVPGTGSFCKVVTDRNNNIDTGVQLSEGNQFELDAYNDRACQGTKVGGVGYTASYNGPAPSGGTFSRILVRIDNPRLSVCSDNGWTDGNPSACR
ncbi:hypothetical protein [Streptomyces sp. NRRL S-646]|uniref:hypothetical protein n=1 Tax=Streptomyces sp. NRRL S-646 TaxID=1463917 RepID=UPI0004C67531|nr:hypothetical protein [Streptomyces sp. NRRL S-646]